MKKILILAVLIVSIPVLGSTQGTFENSPEWNKVDPKLQQMWLTNVRGGDLKQKIDCFVRIRPPLDQGDIDFLAGSGFYTSMTGGTILSGHMQLGSLPGVAKQAFVQHIALKHKKHKKKKKKKKK